MQLSIKIIFIFFLNAILLIILSPDFVYSAQQVDRGWSDDGKQFGYCLPEISPESDSGCYFFDRNIKQWEEIGRKEALLRWKWWKFKEKGYFLPPLTPVYPINTKDQDSGIIELLARISATDDTIELWRLVKSQQPDEKGSQWITVFDYSPDGLWLAAGAIRVDFSDSKNHVHIIVRPTNYWLALAYERAGLDKIREGNIREGIKQLSIAEEILSKKTEQILSTKPVKKGEDLNSWRNELPDEIAVSRVEKEAKIGWSKDGKKLCVCEAWEDVIDGKHASCWIIDSKTETRKPVVVEKTRFLCPIVPENYGVPENNFIVDWGPDIENKTTKVILYIVTGNGNNIAAIMKKNIASQILLKSTGMDTQPDYVFTPIFSESPVKGLLAIGFSRRFSDRSRVEHYIELKKPQEVESNIKEDLATYIRRKPRIIEKIQF